MTEQIYSLGRNNCFWNRHLNIPVFALSFSPPFPRVPVLPASQPLENLGIHIGMFHYWLKTQLLQVLAFDLQNVVVSPFIVIFFVTLCFNNLTLYWHFIGILGGNKMHGFSLWSSQKMSLTRVCLLDPGGNVNLAEEVGDACRTESFSVPTFLNAVICDMSSPVFPLVFDHLASRTSPSLFFYWFHFILRSHLLSSCPAP